VACGLEVRGGVSEISVDGEGFKGSGRLSIQTPGALESPDRYEIEVAGGATKMIVTAR
jgi:hypothetical protein